MKVDMSAQAIALRLKLVSQLRDLCLSLGKAKKSDHQNNQVASTANRAAVSSR